jgi:hypothetical protein
MCCAPITKRMASGPSPALRIPDWPAAARSDRRSEIGLRCLHPRLDVVSTGHGGANSGGPRL